MPYELFLALRYLRIRRGRRAAQLTALAAALGIALGVGALIVALALANGFRDELQDKILRGTAHVTLMRADAQPVDDWRAIVSRLKEVEGVADASATRYDGGLLSGPDGASYAVLRGIDAESSRTIEDVRRTLIAGTVMSLVNASPTAHGNAAHDEAAAGESPVEIIVGAELAARTGLRRVGDEGWIVTGERTPGPPGFAPRARKVRVAGLFRSGLYDYDSAWIYLPLNVAAELAGAPASASVISVEAKDLYASDRVAARIRQSLGDRWTTIDWREANRPLFAALELERRTVAAIVLLITIVAALNITMTLVLVVIERRADIAILSAMGARARSIMTIFVIEGALVGVCGALVGVVLGLAACWAGNHFELVRLPADVYSLSAVPLRPRLADVLWPALAAFLVSLVATVYPARAAARVHPVDVLRHSR